MNPALNHMNYPAAPVSFFGHPYLNEHIGHPQFPHSRSYPSFQEMHSTGDTSSHAEYSASRARTPSGSSPVPNIWDSYDDERPETPSFVGSGLLRVMDSQHSEMVVLVRNALTESDLSANHDLACYRPSTAPPNIDEEFTGRPDCSDLRTFPIKPADSEECIIRRNQSVYRATNFSGTTPTKNTIDHVNDAERMKIAVNGSPTPADINKLRVPFSSQMKWTRTVVNTSSDNQLVSDNPDSSVDYDSTSPKKKLKSATSMNTVQPPISSFLDGASIPISAGSEDRLSKTIQNTSTNGQDSRQQTIYVKQLSNIKQKKPYTLPRRSQLSLRNINGKTYKKDSNECFAFASGFCTAGIFCRFNHNGSTAHSEKTVCSRLLKGLCRPLNESCHLDHGLLAHQYPICSFYLREDCSEMGECELLHVKHAPAAPPCKDFNNGVCFKGIECEQPHRYLYNVIKSCKCYESSREIETSPSSIEDCSSPTLAWIE